MLPDIIMLQSKEGPTQVDIGHALASDACSENVIIGNDAPANLIFQPGETSVVWKADDGRGNVETKVQKVSVIPWNMDRLDFTKIKIIAIRLTETINKVMNTIEECKALRSCSVDLNPLAGTVSHMKGLLKDMSIPETQQRSRQEILERLEPIQVSLRRADSLMKRANEVERGRQGLRSTAIYHLQHARDLIWKWTDLPDEGKIGNISY
jgi:hypothetical protein